MNITFQNGNLLQGDDLVRAVLRSDLAPIPLTLECSVRITDETSAQIVEGNTVIAGRDGYKLMIVKIKDNAQGVGAQGKNLLGVRTFIALYEPCHKIGFVRPTAVIKEKATLGGIYGACGASARIESDFTVALYSCFKGSIPSVGVAQALQEEGGALRLQDGKLKFVRLRDLFKQEPVAKLADDETQNIESGFMERHEVPTFISLDEVGGFVIGNKVKVRKVSYQPRADSRVLFNMTRVLVHAKSFKAQYQPDINAGDLIDVESVGYAVVTAAHVFESGGDGGSSNQYSKFWLATLEE